LTPPVIATTPYAAGTVKADPPSSAERSSFESCPWKLFVFNPAGFVPPEQPIYDGLLARGDLAIWLGREKHRKTNVLLQFAIGAALGRPFLHFPFRPGQSLKVVMLDYESKSQTIKTRHDAITRAMGLSEAEKELLEANLRIIEVRKGFRNGLKFPRFPVRQDRAQADEFRQAEEKWRLFVSENPAGLYIIDPMRCMHAQAENDSAIEALLNRVHEFFGSAAVVISHHLRKRDRNPGHQHSLKDDMRVWADEARGSSAITAHADVIVCQERVVEGAVEMLHLGAYLRDGADIEPIVLRESNVETFVWRVAPDIPLELTLCLEALRKSAGEFPSRTAAAGVLQQIVGTGRSTAYARVSDLVNRGLLTERNGVFRITELMDEDGKAQ
jgi:hypothetical protein